MEENIITWKEAIQILDALFMAQMNLIGNRDESRVEEGEAWAREAFVEYCEIKEISKVKMED